MPLSLDNRINALDKSTEKPFDSRVNTSANNAKPIPEWHEQLTAAANAISPPHFDAHTLKYRAELQSNVKTKPESPAAWHAYLCLLNSERKRHAKPEIAAYMHATLVALYERATSVLPLIRVNRHSEIYLDVWLDLASLRAEDAEDAYLARETFKYMKRECIGLAFPKFWYAWADLEERLGNTDKAGEHRRKGRTRESGGTPASTAKPPNPVTARRPLRPPRRANDVQKENQSTGFTADSKKNDSTAEAATPVASITGRTERTLSSTVDQSMPSPALSNWTPTTRENPSPLVKSTPEPNIVRPTDSGILDSWTKYFAQKRNATASERSTGAMDVTESKPVESLSTSLGRETPPVRSNVRDVRDARDNILSASLSRRTPPAGDVRKSNFSASTSRQTSLVHDIPARESHNVRGNTSSSKQGIPERVPRSTSFESSSRSGHFSSQKQWNYSSAQTSLAVKSSPSVATTSIPRTKETISPEILRSAPTRGEYRPTPSLLSPSGSPMRKDNAAPRQLIVEKRREYSSAQMTEAVPSRERQRGNASDSDVRKMNFSSALSAEKRARQIESEGESVGQLRNSKRKPGTPGPVSRNIRMENRSAQMRETEEPSPLARSSPFQQFSRPSDSSSSATPALDREQHRQRNPPLQSPRQRTFLMELGRDRYIVVNRRQYVILEMVGKGGSSRVYKVLNEDMRIMALKRVKVQMTSTFMVTLNSYANEIALLRKLRGSPNIVQLYDSEVKTDLGLISLIMEYGDIDLAKRLSTTDRKSTINGNFRRLYWNQMLEAVHTIHEARIVHGDLKPANFLIVAGTLKLIDFGIAKAIQTEDTTKIVRETQQGTPNYMSPEALMAEGDESFDDESESGEFSDGRSHKSQYRVGRASDIWSLGCILYQMVYGKTPFAHIKNVLTKLSCIQDPNHEITYRSVDEPLVVDVLKGCLQRDPTKRTSIPDLLNHPYLNSNHERAASGSASNDLALHMAGDSRSVVRSVCEAAERTGYCMTTFSGEKIAVRSGDRAYERLIDAVSRKVVLPQISMGQWDTAHIHGRDRSLTNRILTPTTSGVTNQASRTGLTGNRTGTKTGTGTRTGERYW